jgi:hypothetical protein
MQFFCNRVINIWNYLPDHVIVMADTISRFTYCLHSFNFSGFVEFQYIVEELEGASQRRLCAALAPF